MTTCRHVRRVVTQTILVGRLFFRKNVDERVLVEGESRELPDVFKEFALDLPVLDPHFLKVNVVLPHASILLALQGVLSVACPVCLSHYSEHAVSEVALPLVYLGMRSYLFGKALP